MIRPSVCSTVGLFGQASAARRACTSARLNSPVRPRPTRDCCARRGVTVDMLGPPPEGDAVVPDLGLLPAEHAPADQDAQDSRREGARPDSPQIAVPVSPPAQGHRAPGHDCPADARGVRVAIGNPAQPTERQDSRERAPAGSGTRSTRSAPRPPPAQHEDAGRHGRGHRPKDRSSAGIIGSCASGHRDRSGRAIRGALVFRT